MFKNFWYAVEFSADVQVGSPAKVKVLGQQLVLYRKPSDGSVVAMSDLCVHRGAALSAGEVKGDCIVCPYHGWEYGPDGVVQKIPAHPEKSIPRKARIDSYPVVEKHMMIWVYMGDLPEEERPPIPDWSAVDDTETYRAVTGSFLWRSNYERILENGVDIAHTPFVHRGSFGNPEKPEVPEFEVETSPWHCKASVKLAAPRPRGIWGRINPDKSDLKGRPPVPVSTTWWLPNAILLEVDLPLGELKIFDVNIPIDEDTTLVKFIALRTFFKGAWADKDAKRRVMNVLYQDEAVVNTVRPELLPFDLSDELHVKSDYNQVLYRRRRKELVEMGWSVEGNTIVGEGTAARVEARVIPSPARKEVPELASAWNFKEVRSRQLLESEAARRTPPPSTPLTQATPDLPAEEPEPHGPVTVVETPTAGGAEVRA